MPPQTNRPMTSFAQTGNNQFVPVMPAVSIASQTTAAVTVASSGSIAVNAATSIIRLISTGAGLYLKFGSAPTSSSFDEYVPAGQIIEMGVPLDPTINATLQYLGADGISGSLIVTQK